MIENRFGLGVFTCIFNLDFTKILLVKRNEEKRKMYGADWGNIGGGIELGEFSIDAAIREIKEELCVDVNKDKIKFVKTIEHPDRIGKRNVHVVSFLYVTKIDEKTKICINHEADEHRWFSVDDLPDKMIDTKERILEIRDKARELLK